MQCIKCTAQIKDGSNYCASCGAAQSETPLPDIPISQLSEPQSLQQTDFTDVNSSTPTEPDTIAFDEKKSGFFRKLLDSYKHFGSLSAISKVMHIAVPLVCLMLLFSCFSGGFTNYKNDEETAKNCAVSQIKKQVYSRYEPDVYDIAVVDSDGCGRFIITASSGDNQNWPTRWAVLVKLNPDEETYRATANYHGGGISQDDWVNEYRTDSDYGWGVEQE